MDAKELVQDSSAISDIVTARKVDAVSAGIVKDDESQKLSVLTKPTGQRAQSRLCLHRVRALNPKTSNRPTNTPSRPMRRTKRCAPARSQCGKQCPSSTTPTSSRVPKAHTMPGGRPSAQRAMHETHARAMLQALLAKSKDPPSAQAPWVPRSQGLPGRQGRAAHRRRRRDTPQRKLRERPSRLPHRRLGARRSRARSVEAVSPQRAGSSAVSSPSCS